MSRKTWPIIVGGVGAAAAAAIVSIVVLGGDDDAERKERERVVLAKRAADLELEHQRALAEEKIRAAQAAAIAAAEQAKVAAAEEQAREREAQEARAKAIEEARKDGVLGALALQQGSAFASLTGTGDISSGFDDIDIQGGLLGNDPDAGFGYGRSGFGPGGGGTGLGHLGTGSYGTLGHGSGTGDGYGVGNGRGGMRGRSAAAPTVRLNVAQVNGELDKAIVRRILRARHSQVTYCYQKQLLVEPALAGTVTLLLEIDEAGKVTASDASGLNDEVSSCVGNVMRAASFPRPKAGTVSAKATYAMAPGSSTP